MRTRRRQTPPSRITAMICLFTRRSQHAAFNEEMLVADGDRILMRVRCHGGSRLELVNIQFHRRGTGHARRMLDFLESCVTCKSSDDGYAAQFPSTMTLVVANVANKRFSGFLEKRPGWVKEFTCYLPTDVRRS